MTCYFFSESVLYYFQVMLSRFDANFMKHNDGTCHYLTGLSWSVFDTLCSNIIPYLKLPRTNIPLRNQILMVLVRLRINLPFEYINHQTGISKSTSNLTFHNVLDLRYTKLQSLIHWQGRDNIRQTVPPMFKQHFPRLTCIIDSFEIFIDRPVNLKARAQVYSNYKKHSTVKYFISCSLLGEPILVVVLLTHILLENLALLVTRFNALVTIS